MFVVSAVQDTIQLVPQDFAKPSVQAISDNINAKYANKVIHKIGLCIGLFDIVSTSEGLIGNGTGVVSAHVDFRLVIWRPFKGEILTGRIERFSPTGITLSTDFYQDIVVLNNMLFDGTNYDASEKVFVWTTDSGTPLYFDRHEIARFRIEAEHWIDMSPQQQPGPGEAEKEDDGRGRSPYTIFGSMQHSGMGPTIWW
ncbi:DNA-directed RNA polymerase III complex subunit Rpc25 [Elasticomyces elasticus]|nr:DNA-directed RNA polymerase III complex subunit Rpc25 [Elasticomyces elasticus]